MDILVVAGLLYNLNKIIYDIFYIFSKLNFLKNYVQGQNWYKIYLVYMLKDLYLDCRSKGCQGYDLCGFKVIVDLLTGYFVEENFLNR